MSLQQLGQLVGGQCTGADVHFDAVTTDSRNVQPGQLFVALSGERFDAHDFVDQAREQGAVAALVSRPVNSVIPQIVVPDTLQALSDMAAEVRRQSNIPFVAITGSNGKTSVKEILASILSVDVPVLVTQGNLNNHIGVPLTLLRLQPEHRYAVIEMGANHAGEIAGYCDITHPTVSLVNNVGSAHLEGFGSLDGVASAKGEIIAGLAADGVAVLNRDDAYYAQFKRLAGQRQCISFGFHAEAGVRADLNSIQTQLDSSGFHCCFDLTLAGKTHPVNFALPGQHNVSNALAAAAVAVALGVSTEQIVEGLARVQPVAGRMQVLAGVQGSRLIHDAYNANPRSLQAALLVLAQLPSEPWLVLADFAELGSDSDAIHTQIGRDIYHAGIRCLLATGSQMQLAVAAYQQAAAEAGNQNVITIHFADKAGLIEHLRQHLHADQVVLIKGSRSQQMERVVEALTQQEGGPCC